MKSYLRWIALGVGVLEFKTDSRLCLSRRINTGV